MPGEYLLSYIHFGSDKLAERSVAGVKGVLEGTYVSSADHRAIYRLAPIQRPTTADDFVSALNNINADGIRPFITIVDGHGGKWGRKSWSLSRSSRACYGNETNRNQCDVNCNKKNCSVVELSEISVPVQFNTDILFVTACNSIESEAEWRKFVGPDCEIILSRTVVNNSDFFRLFANFMLFVSGQTGKERITPSKRRELLAKAFRAFRDQETGNRGRDNLFRSERFAVSFGQ